MAGARILEKGRDGVKRVRGAATTFPPQGGSRAAKAPGERRDHRRAHLPGPGAAPRRRYIRRVIVVPGFEHRPGVHCGSTALADALRARGVPLSEAMVFGLGAGLGFYYIVSPALSPTHVFHGRTAFLERTACETIGAPVRERTAPDATSAWRGVRAAMDRGVAPVLVTDLAELPYWGTRTRFGGHRVVLAGHDPDGRVALLADTHLPDLQPVPLDVLDRARASVSPPFGAPGRPWLEVDAPPRPRPRADAIRHALRRQAHDMLLPQDGFSGVSALERFAGDLRGWPEQARDEADRSWCFRYAYQIIDRRGTGGGLFRALYAGFLEEAEEAVPALRPLALAARMRGIAAAWSTLAGALREVGDAPGGAPDDDLLRLARSIAAEERAFHEDVAARVP
jgi:hypothetical protein